VLQTATKPQGTPAADWDKLKSQTTGIFNGRRRHGAYAAKDYGRPNSFSGPRWKRIQPT
jgi:hypothetical protein